MRVAFFNELDSYALSRSPDSRIIEEIQIENIIILLLVMVVIVPQGY